MITMGDLWLHKISYPSWSKKFDDEILLIKELQKYICDYCIAELTNDDGDCDNLVDLLNTPCGCEFIVDDEQMEDKGI